MLRLELGVRDRPVLVGLSANYVHPPNKDGLSCFHSRRDSVRVRCASGTCSADRVAPGGVEPSGCCSARSVL